MTKSLPVIILTLALIWTGAVMVDSDLERRAPAQAWTPDADSIMFRGKALKVVSMGYDAAMADYLFMKMIQYFAHCDDNKLPMHKIFFFADAATDLDPQFSMMYQFAWNMLVNFDVRPIEIIIEESGEILRKGWKNNPDDWGIAQDLAFHNFFYENKPEQAANLYQKAYELRRPDLDFPLYIMLAARLRAKAGDLESTFIVLKLQYDSAKDPKIKKAFEKRMNEAKTEQVARLLDKVVNEFLQKTGRFPESLEELVGDGLIPEVPMDYFGKKYYWNSEKNRVESSSLSSGRYELHFAKGGSTPHWKKD